MPTIRIEYEVPEDDCEKCKQVYLGRRRVCNLFLERLNVGDNYKYQRCQQCIDAEVKEG